MPASPCSAIVNILSATHNAVDLGLCVAYRHGYKPTRAKIRGPGKVGYGCQPAVIREYDAEVRHLVGPPPSMDASGSLVLIGIDGTGANVTATIVTMLEQGHEETQDRDAPGQGGWRSLFAYIGDFATLPRS